MPRRTHRFDNGVTVYDYHLTHGQRERYKKRNVHEADEEDVFLAIIRAIPQDGCYVNVGSAIGYYAILAKTRSPGLTIHAVEPLASHRRYFRENLRLNGLSPDDFQLHGEAISASAGFDLLRDKDYGSSIVRAFQGPLSLGSRVKTLARMLLALFGRGDYRIARTTTLDRLMDAVGRPADLLQMDVQGLEVDVLRSGRRALQAGHVKTFLVGTHGPEIHRACIETLREHGYSIEFEEPQPRDQPDGIIVASKAVRRLGRSNGAD